MDILSPTDTFDGNSIVTIGVFDGVHSGHQKLLGLLDEKAKQENLKRVVITFDVHPASIIAPERAPHMLVSLARKLELLEESGCVDAVLVVPFTQSRVAQSAQDFVTEVIVNQLHAKRVLVGENFHFGYKRQGDVELLRRMGKEHNFDVDPLELYVHDGQHIVSSTLIRQYISVGDVAHAGELLTRPHEISGEVVHGDHMGRELGYPTANTEVVIVTAIPSDGVYAGRVTLPRGDTYRSCISVGVRPMFHEDNIRVIEAHLLDFDEDIYTQIITIEFTEKLRDQMVLDSVDDLVAQIERDVARTREIVTL